MESLFRYIVVRPPSETTKGKPIPLKAQSSLQIELQQARDSGGENALSKIHIQVSNYIGSSIAFVDRLDRLNYGNQLNSFVEQIRNDKEPVNIINEITDATKRIFNSSPSDLIKKQEFIIDLRNIKDSIIAIKIDNSNISQSANLIQLINFLYSMSCISDLQNNQEYLKIVKNYTQLFERPLVLPQEIFPLTKRTLSPQIDSVSTTFTVLKQQRSELDKRLKNLRKLELALDGLRSFEPSDLIYSPDNDKTLFALKRETLDEFGDDIIQILKEMNVSLNRLPIYELIKKLKNKVILEYKDIADLQKKLNLSKSITTIGTSLIGVDGIDASTSLPEYSFAVGAAAASATCLPKTHSSIKPMGVSDLLIVKQNLKEYRVKEIAHIENVLKGESKTREHRRAITTEEFTLIEKEKTIEDEREYESTGRFEMQQEVNETLKEDSSLEAGLSVSGKYGPTVEFQSHVNGSLSQSRERSSKFATEYSTSITNRASSKITEKFKEQRSQRTVIQVEEKNTHGLDNKTGAKNISGIYQWVEKVYEAQVFNYGLRTIYEFVIPEPALFFIETLKQSKTVGENITKPDELTITPKDINEGNWGNKVQEYGLSGVNPPPDEFISIAHSFNGGPATDLWKGENFNNAAKIKIPDGYRAVWATVISLHNANLEYSKSGAYYDVYVTIGKHWNFVDPKTQWQDGKWNTDLDQEIGEIPVSIKPTAIIQFAITFEIMCQRTEKLYEQWQLEVYNAILQKHQKQLDEYNDKISALASQIGVQIRGRNPAINLELMKYEIKKECISLITRQNFDLCDGYDSRGNRPTTPPDLSLLGLNFNNSDELGKYIRFFENAFEWENMNFIFYPYFWSQKGNDAYIWMEKIRFEDTDPMFESFLKAGAARVIVPVRSTSEQRKSSNKIDPTLGFEAAIDHFMNTGEIWNGQGMPNIGSDIYVSIIDEIRERSNAPADEFPQGEPWDVIVPTTLVKLRLDDSLPKWKKDPAGNWEPAN